MGEAYECDRCGALREGAPEIALTVEVGFSRSRPNDKRPVEFRERMSPAPNDLCRSCHNDLRRWYMEGGGDGDDVTPERDTDE